MVRRQDFHSFLNIQITFRIHHYELTRKLSGYDRFNSLSCSPPIRHAAAIHRYARIWSLLNMRQTEKYGQGSSQDLPELFYSFFLQAREEKRRLPSAEWADKHPFLVVHQQDRLSCLCQRIIWSKIWPIVSNVHSFVR